MNKMKTFMGLMALALFAAGCSYANTEPTEFACAYGGGPFESKAQKGDNPIPPSSGRQFIGVGGSIVYLRSDVRNYVVSKAGSGDRATIDFIKSPASDGPEIEWEVSIKYRINTDNGCTFWDEHGNRFDVDTDEGWRNFLEVNLRPILDAGIKSQSNLYEWEDIWRNRPIGEDGERTWDVIQDDLGETLVTELNRSLSGSYFCGPSWEAGSDDCPPFEVLISSATPENESLTNRYSDIQAEQAETEKQREIKARELEAVELDADTDLAEAEAQLGVSEINRQKAIIDAEADAALCEQLASIGVDCTMYLAAENGSIEFWVTDGEGPVITRDAG